MKPAFDLDDAILNFSVGKLMAYWTVREAVEGIGIFGGIGSGKTSGSGRLLATKYLSNGWGGCVLTAKPSEKDLWIEYCTKTGRLADLIIVEPGGAHRFNFINYESSLKSGGHHITENLVQVLKTVIRSAEEKNAGKSDDPFWESALDMLMFNTIDLCLLANGKVSLQDLYEVAMTIPKPGVASSREEGKVPFIKAFRAAQAKVDELLEAYKEQLSDEDKKKLESRDMDFMVNHVYMALPEMRTFEFVDQFFVETYRTLSEKTRSIVEFSFSGFLFRLLKDPIYSLFCHGESTFKPEDSLDGKIILINLPVKNYHKVGRDCQVLFKYIWQRAMEKRDINQNGRPVFLWADEAQLFLHEYDAEYQATARSSRISTVYISQNLANYFANMGGANSEHRVKSFLGTLGTKIFHNNADIETNEYASSLIGNGYTEEATHTATMAGKFSSSRGSSYKLERIVRPEEFVGLRSGGKNNNFLVEGYMHRQGQPFPDGWNFRKITFSQQ